VEYRRLKPTCHTNRPQIREYAMTKKVADAAFEAAMVNMALGKVGKLIELAAEPTPGSAGASRYVTKRSPTTPPIDLVVDDPAPP